MNPQERLAKWIAIREQAQTRIAELRVNLPDLAESLNRSIKQYEYKLIETANDFIERYEEKLKQPA